MERTEVAAFWRSCRETMKVWQALCVTHRKHSAFMVTSPFGWQLCWINLISRHLQIFHQRRKLVSVTAQHWTNWSQPVQCKLEHQMMSTKKNKEYKKVEFSQRNSVNKEKFLFVCHIYSCHLTQMVLLIYVTDKLDQVNFLKSTLQEIKIWQRMPVW